jgi:hypothetical protein
MARVVFGKCNVEMALALFNDQDEFLYNHNMLEHDEEQPNRPALNNNLFALYHSIWDIGERAYGKKKKPESPTVSDAAPSSMLPLPEDGGDAPEPNHGNIPETEVPVAAQTLPEAQNAHKDTAPSNPAIGIADGADKPQPANANADESTTDNSGDQVEHNDHQDGADAKQPTRSATPTTTTNKSSDSPKKSSPMKLGIKRLRSPRDHTDPNVGRERVPVRTSPLRPAGLERQLTLPLEGSSASTGAAAGMSEFIVQGNSAVTVTAAPAANIGGSLQRENSSLYSLFSKYSSSGIFEGDADHTQNDPEGGIPTPPETATVTPLLTPTEMIVPGLPIPAFPATQGETADGDEELARELEEAIAGLSQESKAPISERSSSMVPVDIPSYHLSPEIVNDATEFDEEEEEEEETPKERMDNGDSTTNSSDPLTSSSDLPSSTDGNHTPAASRSLREKSYSIPDLTEQSRLRAQADREEKERRLRDGSAKVGDGITYEEEEADEQPRMASVRPKVSGSLSVRTRPLLGDDEEEEIDQLAEESGMKRVVEDSEPELQNNPGPVQGQTPRYPSLIKVVSSRVGGWGGRTPAAADCTSIPFSCRYTLTDNCVHIVVRVSHVDDDDVEMGPASPTSPSPRAGSRNGANEKRKPIITRESKGKAKAVMTPHGLGRHDDPTNYALGSHRRSANFDHVAPTPANIKTPSNLRRINHSLLDNDHGRHLQFNRGRDAVSSRVRTPDGNLANLNHGDGRRARTPDPQRIIVTNPSSIDVSFLSTSDRCVLITRIVNAEIQDRNRKLEVYAQAEQGVGVSELTSQLKATNEELEAFKRYIRHLVSETTPSE